MLFTGCTVGGAARLEGSLDIGGPATYRASLDPGIGLTRVDPPDDVANAKALIILTTIGGGWGSDGWFWSAGLGGVTVPRPGGGFGLAWGIRARLDGHCGRWSIGIGAAHVVAQLRAEDYNDGFGPNPRLTRMYHDATAFAGFAACDGGSTFRAMVGAAYELGLGALLFAPGP